MPQQPAAGAGVLGLVGDDRLGGQQQSRDRRRVLQGRTGHLGGVDDAGLEQVLEHAGGGVEADVAGLALDLLDDDGAFEAGVVGDEPSRGLERRSHGRGAGGLVAVERLDDLGHRRAGAEQGGAATGDHAFLDGRTGCREGVLDAVLLLLELHLGGRADLDDGDAAGQLGQTLLELLAVPVGVGVVDLAA